MPHNRCAVVTGASSQIGNAVVADLLQEGWNVVANVFDPRVTPAIDVGTDGFDDQRSVTVRGDMTDADKAEEVALSALDHFGRIDALVNLAGGGNTQPFDRIDTASWHRMIDINLTTAFLASQAVLPTMMKQRSGKIVNVSSQLAFKGAPHMPHYAAAKAGLGGLTRSLALATADYGITVNTVAPGAIDTDGHVKSGTTPAELARQVAQIPLNRLGTVTELTACIRFLLASPDSDFITGQTLHVNGGDVMV